jgi:gephyrin
MGDARLRPAVLVISDTASKDPSTDKAGNVLTDTFSADGGDQWRPPLVQIVPDSIIEIQRTVQQWSDSEDYFNLIITTGGTGFAVKDVTPEVGLSVFLLRYNLS